MSLIYLGSDDSSPNWCWYAQIVLWLHNSQSNWVSLYFSPGIANNNLPYIFKIKLACHMATITSHLLPSPFPASFSFPRLNISFPNKSQQCCTLSDYCQRRFCWGQSVLVLLVVVLILRGLFKNDDDDDDVDVTCTYKRLLMDDGF